MGTEDCFLPSITQVNNCYLGKFLFVWWTMFENNGTLSKSLTCSYWILLVSFFTSSSLPFLQCIVSFIFYCRWKIKEIMHSPPRQKR